MPTPNKLKAPFNPGCHYHIVCKSIDGLFLFYDKTDYEVFLHRFKKFTSDFIDVWSYCLLSNHTHLVVKIKSAAVIAAFIKQLPVENKTKAMIKWVDNKGEQPFETTSPDAARACFDEMIERQMNSFLVSYANYLNNKYERKGGIFQKPFKRIQINDEGHLQQAIIYSNANAQKHKLVSDFSEYVYSSFNAAIRNDNYFINSGSVVDFFGSIEQFIRLHKEQVAYFYGKGWPSSRLE